MNMAIHLRKAGKIRAQGHEVHVPHELIVFMEISRTVLFDSPSSSSLVKGVHRILVSHTFETGIEFCAYENIRNSVF
jgi:hypothetical protein